MQSADFAPTGLASAVGRRSIWLGWAALVGVDFAGRAAYLAPRLLTVRGLANYVVAGAALWLVLRLLMLTTHRRRVGLFAVVVALPMAVQWAMFRSYGQFVEPADFVALYDAPRVVLGAASHGAEGLGTLVVLTLALGSAWLLPREALPLRLRTFGLASVMLAAELGVGATYWGACPTLEHSQPAFSCALLGLMRRETIRTSAGARVVVPKAPATTPLPNIVLVVGESLAASHLSLYGYDRDTSPRLAALQAQGQLVALRDAAVMGPNTRTSVPYILTGLEGPDPDGRVFRAPTVLEYAKARGYHTAFVSAQEEAWGNFDVLFREGVDTFRTGIEFAPEVDVLKGADDLVVLEQGVLPLLRSLPQPFFVVLHMDGSHLPYRDHSPPSHKVFLPEDGVNSTNAYDNSIRVTDEYLARTFEALRARDPGAWMFFTSDHGQPLGEGGAFFNRGYQSNVVRDPLLVFAPPDADASRWAAVAAAQVSACDLAPTLVHLMGASPVSAMDCVDWLEAPPSPRVRVVSAYTPTYVTEPTLLLLLPDGQRALYDLGHGTVTRNDGAIRPMAEWPLPDAIEGRLHPERGGLR
ncbi:MAG TPA: phosphoethanolamine transferase [Polyangiaceae bacterium]